MARLSTELRRNIVETLGSPVIPLFLGRNTGTEILWDYAGSGVLVEVDGEDGILTAEHVIFSDNRLRNATLLATIPGFTRSKTSVTPFRMIQLFTLADMDTD